MKFKAQGTIQVFVTAEFEANWDDDITAMAYAALSQEAGLRGMRGFEIINFEFDQVVNEGDNG